MQCKYRDVASAAAVQHAAGGRDAEVVVTEHDSLGEAGRAPCVEDAGQVIAVAPSVGHRFAFSDQGLVAEHSFGRFAVARVDQVS